jgi:hypothetical protein
MTVNTCIDYKGVLLDVVYDFYPAEPATYEHPGAAMSIEVATVRHKGVDISSILSVEAISEIEEQISNEWQSENRYVA